MKMEPHSVKAKLLDDMGSGCVFTSLPLSPLARPAIPSRKVHLHMSPVTSPVTSDYCRQLAPKMWATLARPGRCFFAYLLRFCRVDDL